MVRPYRDRSRIRTLDWIGGWISVSVERVAEIVTRAMLLAEQRDS